MENIVTGYARKCSDRVHATLIHIYAVENYDENDKNEKKTRFVNK